MDDRRPTRRTDPTRIETPIGRWTRRERMRREEREHEATRAVEAILIGCVIAAFFIIAWVRLMGGRTF